MPASETFATLLLSIASVSLLVGGIGIMNVMLASGVGAHARDPIDALRSE